MNLCYLCYEFMLCYVINIFNAKFFNIKIKQRYLYFIYIIFYIWNLLFVFLKTAIVILKQIFTHYNINIFNIIEN